MTLGYQKFGSGPHKVMALHGWFGDHTAYDAMRTALSPDEFTYVFPAYRGYGLSRHLTGAYTNKEIARDVIELADEFGWHSFSLIGHSMGGKAIQRVLVDAPKRVRKLVAVTPAPASSAPIDDLMWELFESAARNMVVREVIMAISVGNRHSKAWTEYMARYSARTSTVEAFAAYLLAWAKEDFAADVQGRDVPIKVILGQYDATLKEDVLRATFMSCYSHAELEVISNAGHYPTDETPIALATSIEAFLRT
jgi:pimeloyl-ACP methyl ester carboxylesterase